MIQYSIDEEIWKTVPGWEAYQASSLGRVRRICTGLILSQNKDKDGYLRLNLSINGRRRNYRVYMLVMLVFVGPVPTDKPHVAHWDGIETNNKLINLRYATVSENSIDKHRHGRMPMGMKSHKAKISDDEACAIYADRYKNGLPIRDLVEKYSTSTGTVHNVIYKNGRFSRIDFSRSAA